MTNLTVQLVRGRQGNSGGPGEQTGTMRRFSHESLTTELRIRREE
jgi:hypothetical protein